MKDTENGMKTYLPIETKAERKSRKAREKAGLSVEEEIVVEQPNKRYVVCLKYGTKYSADYVNKLYYMVSRNLTLEHEFVCFTENSRGIDSKIRIEPLELHPRIQGWWYKPFFFNPKLKLQGTILFLDLDLVIFRNIDNLFQFRPNKFLIIRDFNRHRIPNYQKFNSSVFRLNTGQHMDVYNDFMKDPLNTARRFHGDQDWIRYKITNDFDFFPDEWIQSYKWEMRKEKPVRLPSGKRNFETIGEPTVLDTTSIAVFHGDPNPEDCKDPWVIDNWK